jgi:hypothetical protein
MFTFPHSQNGEQICWSKNFSAKYSSGGMLACTPRAANNLKPITLWTYFLQSASMGEEMRMG